MMVKNFVLVFLFGLMVTYSAIGQISAFPTPPVKKLDTPLGLGLKPPNDISIRNIDRSNQVEVNMSKDGENWFQAAFPSNFLREYKLETDFIYIGICTGTEETCMFYKLMKGERYALYRNQDLKVWDLATLKLKQ